MYDSDKRRLSAGEETQQQQLQRQNMFSSNPVKGCTSYTMKSINITKVAVICALCILQLEAATTLSGFGFELLQSQLVAFESRMQTQLEQLQLSVKQTQHEQERLKQEIFQKLAHQDSGVYLVQLIRFSNESFEVFRDGNLNGIYMKGGKQDSNKGIHWYYFRGYRYSLKATKMMIRPYNHDKK
uniref:Fibrinogen C-terminal domain-containing protein n=1 Tax=Anopheles quadriannulatus TaxID=34691 RepID=A0A182WUT9_ANOQN